MSPKILLIDIETSPIQGFSWGMYDVNILAVVEPTKIICVGWKWLNNKDINVRSLSDYDSYTPGSLCDRALVTEVWKTLDEADVVIAHNGDSFDIKVLNARFVANGLTAPSDYRSIDTLKVAKKYFKFNSNKLDELGKYLGLGGKAGTGGFATWLGCMKGDKKAWEVMKRYNAKDVELLESVYLRLRPFMSNHPNLNVISPSASGKAGTLICQVCQSVKTTKRGFSVTKAGRYQRFSCNDCASWSSGSYERV